YRVCLRYIQHRSPITYSLFFLNGSPTTELYTLSLHDALPICFINTMKNINHTRSSISDDIRNILCSSANMRRAIPLMLLLVWLRSEERFSRNAETDLVCRLLLEKKNTTRLTEDCAERIYALRS